MCWLLARKYPIGLPMKFCFMMVGVLQERATKISHGNTARLASMHGDTHLAKLCGMIAADEGRHEGGSKGKAAPAVFVVQADCMHVYVVPCALTAFLFSHVGVAPCARVCCTAAYTAIFERNAFDRCKQTA